MKFNELNSVRPPTAFCINWKKWKTLIVPSAQTLAKQSVIYSSCPCASSFWSEFIDWYQCISKKALNLSKNEVMYGVLNDWSSCSTLNHLILMGKYFLYCRALNSVKFQFADYVNLVNDKMEIEHQIALMSNKHNTIFKKWSGFINWCMQYKA